MKILHISQILLGGTASYLSEIAPAQIASFGEDRVRILAPSSEHGHLAGLPPVTLLPCADVGRSPAALLGFSRTARQAIGRFAPDIIHLHNSFAGAVVRLPWLLGGRRPRIVYCAHGWSFCMDVSERRKRAYAATERLLAHAADRIVSISRSEDAEAARRGLPRGKLRMIYNGIAAALPAAGDPPPMAPGKINLLFVGRHDRQKGYDLLLEAMAALAGAPLHLHVVSGSLHARTFRLPPNVTDHGWQPRDRVTAFMQAADAIVIPSRWEGFGLVAAEAMRAGLPVIASDAGALPELVEDGRSGILFRRGSTAALTDTLRRIDRAALAGLGEAGRARLGRLFTAERMNAELLSLYRELVPA